MLSRTESNGTFTIYQLKLLGLNLPSENSILFYSCLSNCLKKNVEFNCATHLTNRIICVNCSHYSFLHVGLHFFSSVLAEK